MSSTPSNADRLRVSNGAARRTRSNNCASCMSSRATMATICCASTSSGLRGYRDASTLPSCMSFATAAHASRSPRNFGMITPSLIASIRCPARPMRCRPLATDDGASICTTRSIAPMSMPSSSEDVAISAGSRPALSRSSMSVRCSRARDPWWERASVSPASSLIAAARRSASLRLLTKINVDRWVRISSTRRGWIAVQIDARCVADAGPLATSITSPIRDRSSTGTSTCRWIGRRTPASTMVTGRKRAGPVVAPANSAWIVCSATSVVACFGDLRAGVRVRFGARGRSTPPRKRATSSSGRCVADKPMRCKGLGRSDSRRSSESARCAPRLVGTSE